MPKYHILYEAEFEQSRSFTSDDVDNLREDLDYTFDVERLTKGNLIVTPIEPEPELPTTPGSVVQDPAKGFSHPGWALNKDGEWVSLFFPGLKWPAYLVKQFLREGKVQVIFDAGKARS